jgi:cobalt-precorrin-5B (C1)-methyltransferase
MLDMGDFAGGMLKYLAKHPVPRVTIGGGIGKITKLAQGAMDLHSSRTQVDFEALNALSLSLGLADIHDANTALEAVTRAGNGLAEAIAKQARERVEKQLKNTVQHIDIVVIDRSGLVLGQAE